MILIGGYAGRILGASRTTDDIDLVYDRSPENVDRLVQTLAPYHPYPRGAPRGLPFHFDRRQILNGLNFTFESDLGWIDLLGEAAGGGTYNELLPNAVRVRIDRHDVMCVTLETLIRLKTAAGRPKDFEAIAELQSLRIRSKDVSQ